MSEKINIGLMKWNILLSCKSGPCTAEEIRENLVPECRELLSNLLSRLTADLYLNELNGHYGLTSKGNEAFDNYWAAERFSSPSTENEQYLLPIHQEEYQRILDAMAGRALSLDDVRDLLPDVSYRKIDMCLRELKHAERIVSDKKVGGYFRPDKPPKLELN